MSLDRRLELLRRPDLPATHKLVAIALMDAENEDGLVSGVTHADIAAFLGVQRTYVAYVIRQLRERGIIASESEPHHRGSYRFVGDYAATTTAA
jgi:DNA-binding IscR family transcriptional regulator